MPARDDPARIPNSDPMQKHASPSRPRAPWALEGARPSGTEKSPSCGASKPVMPAASIKAPTCRAGKVSRWATPMYPAHPWHPTMTPHPAPPRQLPHYPHPAPTHTHSRRSVPSLESSSDLAPLRLARGIWSTGRPATDNCNVSPCCHRIEAIPSNSTAIPWPLGWAATGLAST